MTLAPLQLLGDERLAQMAVAGDRRAFDVLFERHRRGLERCARSIVGNKHDAQDALQSSALKAFVGLAGRGAGAPLRPWLYRIATNESITVLRRRRARPSEQLGDLLPDVTGGPEELLLVREDLRHLLDDLAHISERQRTALLMRQALGLDYEEIGRRLQTTPLAARQCVFSARRALRRSADGREASCATVLVTLASGDGRALRAAPIRAHLRTCPDCRAARPPSRVRSRVAAMLPTAPSGLAAIARAFLPGSGADTIAAPAKALAVAAVLTVGAGEATFGRHDEPPRATATAVRPAQPRKAAAAVRHAPRTHTVAAVAHTVAARAAPVRQVVSRAPAVVAQQRAPRRIASAPKQQQENRPEPQRQFVSQPTAPDEQQQTPQQQQPSDRQFQPEARQASARCHDPEPPGTSQPAPTPS